jgi:tripartite-type tricarboxylate transporter receptor subunit TctC
VAVAEGLLALGRIGRNEAGVGVRQVEREEVGLALYPADDADRLAEVGLGVPWRMHQRYEHLIAQMGSIANALLVAPDFPAQSFQAFIELAKAEAESVLCASPGRGSSGHMAIAMLQQAASIKLKHVPYRGAAPAITDVLGGHVKAVMINVDIALPQVRDGKLKALAVTSEEPNPLYPDTPTVADSGFPGFAAIGWMGLSAPAGTPNDIVAQLNKVINEAFATAQIKERYAASGYVPGGGSSAKYAAFISAEIDKWAKVAKATGVSIE